jgi:hypothetical protein
VSAASAAPLERLGPYGVCEPCAAKPPAKKKKPPVPSGWTLRLRPTIGYFDYGDELTLSLVQVNLPNNLGVIPCRPVLARFFSCSLALHDSASGTTLGADVGGDYRYGPWTFSLDFEYDNVSTTSAKQGHFDNTGLIPTVSYALSPDWTAFAGYEWRYKGTGVLASDYYLQNGLRLGVRYDGIHLAPAWQLHLGLEGGFSRVSFYGLNEQFFQLDKLPLENVANVPDVSVGAQSIKLSLQIDQPGSPHAIGADFREVFSNTVNAGFNGVATIAGFNFTAPATVEGTFHEYYAHLYYQYSFGKH